LIAGPGGLILAGASMRGRMANQSIEGGGLDRWATGQPAAIGTTLGPIVAFHHEDEHETKDDR
jgi:hypothetical protein